MAKNINRNVYMYLNTRIFSTTGHARVLLYMFIRLELGGMVQDFISVYILCSKAVLLLWIFFILCLSLLYCLVLSPAVKTLTSLLSYI